LGHGFSFGRIFIDWDAEPDHLTVFEEGVVVVSVVLFDEQQQIVDDGTGGDGSFVVAVVVEKAVEEDVLERFSFHAEVPSEGDGFGREVTSIPWHEG
jgi:hypothetical protein